jgi:hypothetical protein
MKRQREQVEFFALPVAVPRRTKTPIFTGAHAASENASGNRYETVPEGSQTHQDACIYSCLGGSQSGTVPSGGTTVPTPKGWSGNREENSEPDPLLVGMGTACDGCGFEVRIAIVTDYGGRLCRRCLHGD